MSNSTYMFINITFDGGFYMPRPKYPTPDNNFPRFIDEYLRGHSDSLNELACKINKKVPEELAVPIDNSEMKSGNSNIFSWKKGSRVKSPEIRAALCDIFDITYIETLFLIPNEVTKYIFSVYDYLSNFICNLQLKDNSKGLSLNIYNISQAISLNSVSSKNYSNLSYLIMKIIKAEQDKVEFIHMKKYGNFIKSRSERPWSFWQYSQTNIYCSNEHNNLYRWDPEFMLQTLGNSFNYLREDLSRLIETDSEFSDNANYNYYRLALINDSGDENLMCLCIAINLLIKMVDRIDSEYLDKLSEYNITEEITAYSMAPEVLLENNEFLRYRK